MQVFPVFYNELTLKEKGEREEKTRTNTCDAHVQTHARTHTVSSRQTFYI